MPLLVEKLSQLCRQWGGELASITHAQYEALSDKPLKEFSPAPFTNGSLGVDWQNKIIYHADRPWYELVHEMGHVFACHEPPPEAVEEYAFFGWEVALVRLIEGDIQEWVRGNKDYVVTGNVELGSLSSYGLIAIFEETSRKAIELGLVVDGIPVPIR